MRSKKANMKKINKIKYKTDYKFSKNHLDKDDRDQAIFMLFLPW